jgi:hypothetical protein
MASSEGLTLVTVSEDVALPTGMESEAYEDA